LKTKSGFFPWFSFHLVSTILIVLFIASLQLEHLDWLLDPKKILKAVSPLKTGLFCLSWMVLWFSLTQTCSRKSVSVTLAFFLAACPFSGTVLRFHPWEFFLLALYAYFLGKEIPAGLSFRLLRIIPGLCLMWFLPLWGSILFLIAPVLEMIEQIKKRQWFRMLAFGAGEIALACTFLYMTGKYEALKILWKLPERIHYQFLYTTLSDRIFFFFYGLMIFSLISRSVRKDTIVSFQHRMMLVILGGAGFTLSFFTWNPEWRIFTRILNLWVFASTYSVHGQLILVLQRKSFYWYQIFFFVVGISLQIFEMIRPTG